MHLDRSRYSVTPSALALLEAALHGLAAAECEASAEGKYVGAHRAASRAAAALVDARGGAASLGRRPQSVWELLQQVEPTLSEWAGFFASGTGKRAAVEAGLPRAVSLREANDLLQDAETFVSIVENVLAIAKRRLSLASDSTSNADTARHPKLTASLNGTALRRAVHAGMARRRPG